jgi:hypothetical protein
MHFLMLDVRPLLWCPFGFADHLDITVLSHEVPAPFTVQSLLPTFLFYLWAFSIAAGAGIEADAAGIGIPASGISVWYRSILVPDWVPIIRYRTDTGIGIFVPSGTGLSSVHMRDSSHSGILSLLKGTGSRDGLGLCWYARPKKGPRKVFEFSLRKFNFFYFYCRKCEPHSALDLGVFLVTIREL